MKIQKKQCEIQKKQCENIDEILYILNIPEYPVYCIHCTAVYWNSRYTVLHTLYCITEQLVYCIHYTVYWNIRYTASTILYVTKLTGPHVWAHTQRIQPELKSFLTVCVKFCCLFTRSRIWNRSASFLNIAQKSCNKSFLLKPLSILVYFVYIDIFFQSCST